MDCHNGRTVDKSDNLWISVLVAMGYSLYIGLDSSSQESPMIQQLYSPPRGFDKNGPQGFETHTHRPKGENINMVYIYILYTVYIYTYINHEYKIFLVEMNNLVE